MVKPFSSAERGRASLLLFVEEFHFATCRDRERKMDSPQRQTPHRQQLSKPMQRAAPAASPGSLPTATHPAELAAGACRADPANPQAHPPEPTCPWKVNVQLSPPGQSACGVGGSAHQPP